MPATTNRTKRSEKGLLTPDNCVIALIDHQAQMMFGVAGFDRQSIINNTVARGAPLRRRSSSHGGAPESCTSAPRRT